MEEGPAMLLITKDGVGYFLEGPAMLMKMQDL